MALTGDSEKIATCWSVLGGAFGATGHQVAYELLLFFFYPPVFTGGKLLFCSPEEAEATVWRRLRSSSAHAQSKQGAVHTLTGRWRVVFDNDQILSESS